MNKALLIIGISGLLFAESACAAKDCTTVQQKSGRDAYQKCLYDEQETRIRDQIAAYKAMIDRNKESVKAQYDTLINQEEFSWKDVDLKMQIEEAGRKLRITQLGTAKENAEQVQIEKNLLTRLQKIRSLTSSVHGKKESRLKKRKEGELAAYDDAIAEYELQLRRQNMPSLWGSND
ncbi:MAG: hypothetical protein PHX87_03285 [Candidatus Peribacteraceae bacterium]|nr:hypothetical protein [Candidatus Peribacteraceae bacterium]MDD5742431.1 hypothetical protein [Candidatus Peribacteraceae bacterium]